MSIRDRLKAETATQHQNLEDAMNLLREDYTIGEYGALIQAFYGFYKPFEDAVSAQADKLPAALEWPKRLKSHQLAEDIEKLGLPLPTRLAGPSDLPALDTPAQILGVLYVIEGSTLGGMVISRHFKKILDLDATNGAAFYVGYGPETVPFWKGFLAILESEVTAPADQDACVKAAADTFDLMSVWLAPAMPSVKAA
jgi:heme oxygenase